MLCGRPSLTSVSLRTGGPSTPNRDFCRKSHGALRIFAGFGTAAGRFSERFRVAPVHGSARNSGAVRTRRSAPKSVVPRDFSGKNRRLGSTGRHARSRHTRIPPACPRLKSNTVG